MNEKVLPDGCLSLLSNASGDDIMKNGFFKKKVRLVLQNEDAECGQACLTMIFNFHGYGVTLPELRQDLSSHSGGMTLGQMAEMSTRHGFQSTPYTLQPAELSQLRLPCILHWNFTHFVVLTRVGKTGVEILDPALGAVTVSNGKLRKHFTGVAVEILPGENFIRKKKEKIRLKDVTGKVFGFVPFIIKILFVSLLLDAVALLLPRVSQTIIDKVVLDNDRHFLFICILIGMALLLVQFVLFIINGWMKIYFDSKFVTQWRKNIFSKMLSLPVGYFTSRGFGNIMYRFRSIDAIQGYLTDKFASLILNAVSSLIILVVMLFYSLPMTLIAAVTIVLYSFVRYSTYHYLKENAYGIITLKSREQSGLINALKFIQLHKLYNGVGRVVTQYAGIIAEETSINSGTRLITIIGAGVNQLLSGIRGVLILAVGVLLVMGNKMTVGMIFAFTAYSVEFSKRATLVIDVLYQLQMLNIHILRLSEIVHAPEETGMHGKAPLPESAEISLRNIYHQYSSGGRYTLEGINIDIQHNETVLLTGGSGSGKSTLVKLVLGLTEPAAGIVSVGGIHVRELGKNQLRSMTATVLQGDGLFPGTIYENITFDTGTEHLDEIQRMAASVGIHHVISSLPLGYFSIVGDMSDFLSGGEKQKLLVMRALFKKPRILILDEADSNLDPVSEKAIFDAVMAYPCTKIIISHKTERPYQVDRVICLKDGKIHA
ncbi:TPA: peptidase domain-containing ABC transporter [Salmonella enterica subsp. enterica serovar 13,23:b:-]